MRAAGLTVFLLMLSNVFMTFAWYAHLRELSAKPWMVAVLVSWGIAFSSTCCRCRPTGLGIM